MRKVWIGKRVRRVGKGWGRVGKGFVGRVGKTDLESGKPNWTGVGKFRPGSSREIVLAESVIHPARVVVRSIDVRSSAFDLHIICKYVNSTLQP